jgi:glycosyltransferase involved in cell wall biosynthesis
LKGIDGSNRLTEPLLQLQHRALYAAFDLFPSRKGAAIHIDRFARSLFEYAGGGLLYVLGDESLPAYQREDDIEILRFVQRASNYLDRALAYGRLLRHLIEGERQSLRLCHFRDIWSGVPILENKSYATVFEVNALPSIELPFSYPQIAPATLDKIRLAEDFCLQEADTIITPSQTIKEKLLQRGADVGKITVIPNGADVKAKPARPAEAPENYLLYFGALQRWQGVDVLLKAFARLADFEDLHLLLCVSTHPRTARAYQKLAEKLEIASRLHWYFGLEETELAPLRAHARLSVAPLTECSRNLKQGCSPLKILESMAAGVPVVASDIPAIREIISDDVDGKLVRADRPSELARAIRVLLEYPDELRRLGDNARRKIEQQFTWKQATDRLQEIYQSLPLLMP